MTEEERVKAVGELFAWAKADKFTAQLCRTVCVAYSLPDVGHLARFAPDAFDDLHEEVVALRSDD